jgi:hypothetical protein
MPVPADVDGESVALRTLASRAARLRAGVGLIFIALGVAAGWFGERWIDGLFFSHDGYRAVGSATVAFDFVGGFMPPIAAALLIGRALGRALVRSRRPEWIAELAKRHRVPPEVLHDAASAL